jgi:WD40-like Beta Propeller Repeat
LVLRCSRCTEEVSEWAARCPSCGHSTDDAEELAPEAQGVQAVDDRLEDVDSGSVLVMPAARFQTRPQRRTKALIAVAVAALVVGAGTVLSLRVTPGGIRSAAGIALPLTQEAISGPIVAQDSRGTVILSDLNGDHVVSFRRLGTYRGYAVVASLDHRFLATPRGGILAVTGDRLSVADLPTPTRDGFVGGLDSFSDGDRALLVTTGTESGLGARPISAMTLANHKEFALGTPDEAAGDPQALGAFVSVVAPIQPDCAPVCANTGPADSRVELRDVGRPSVVLATATALNRDVNEIPDIPVHLSVFPNPAGDAVAVVVDTTATTLEPDAEMVVLNRSGHVLGVVGAAAGLYRNSRPAWSPDGRSLAYATFGNTGTALAVWTVGGRTLTRSAPDNGADFGFCLWASDGSAVLCPTSGRTQVPAWDVGSAQSGPLLSVPSLGRYPIAWLPRSGR